jgi:hypothetical protein
MIYLDIAGIVLGLMVCAIPLSVAVYESGLVGGIIYTCRTAKKNAWTCFRQYTAHMFACQAQGDSRCTICLENVPVWVAGAPCLHMLYCDECIDSVIETPAIAATCSRCRAPVRQYVRIQF